MLTSIDDRELYNTAVNDIPLISHLLSLISHFPMTFFRPTI